jgi:hypothetical protein
MRTRRSDRLPVHSSCGRGLQLLHTRGGRGILSSAIPYVACAALVLGLALGEDWLQRRSGQSWWTIDQLVWGTLAAAVTVFVLVAGHPLVALLMAGFAALEFLSVRRSWVKRTSRDLLERNRLELEHRDAPAASPSGIGVRRSVFVLLIALLWTLLEHWGLSRGAAGIVSAIVAIVVFFPSQRRSSASSVTTHDGGWNPPSVGADRFDVPPDADDPDRPATKTAMVEHEFEFTLSGRPAKLLGRLLERSSRRR